ncbi:Tyrosine recombinase XerD [Bacteroidales bacterium Barb6]|nr:Tyrosine recombinase XerD [Bacteroidales bacterium Barb6]
MVIDEFLDYLRYERAYSEHTVTAYECDLHQFEEFVKICQEGEFDPVLTDSDIIRNWIVCLMDARSAPASVNRKLSSLKSFFKYLVKQKIVSVNPVRLVTGPKMKKPLPYFVREKELGGLLDGDGFDDDFEGVRDRLIMELLYETGMRRSELVGIRNRDVDYEAMVIKVTGKRNKQRLIPFAARLKESLTAYTALRNREIGGGTSEWLLLKKNGEPVSVQTVYGVVKKRLGDIPTLAKRSPHILRHSFATSMLNNGAKLNAVKELLGHSSLTSTAIYTHTSFAELKKVYHAHPRAKKKR